MIVYRKGGHARLRRWSAPEPPFWCATAVAPYGSRRGAPIAIDYLDLRASFAERLEVTVAEGVRDELERTRAVQPPVLIEATEFAERVFGRGEEALAFCRERGLAALHLVSTRSAIPSAAADAVVAIAAWPLEADRLEELFFIAGERGLRWGVAIPVIFPVTTTLGALTELADLAQRHGAAFFAAIAVDVDPTAKQAIAQSLSLEGEDETYAMLFHAPLEPVHLATERHIAALAEERGMADFIVPPRWDEHSNWNAAALLTLTASRMLALDADPELATTLARAARVVAELDKPIARIAEAASLSIVEALDEVSVDVLTEWLASGESSFVERVNREWRLRRDAGM